MTQPKYDFKNFTQLNPEEIRLVWQWRNDYKIRCWMYNDQEILFEDHLNFINTLKNNIHKRYWLIFRNDQPLGVSSIVDIEDQAGEWGYYLEPASHEKSFGVEFYYHTLQYVFETFELETLYGYALAANHGANSLNDLFGFQKVEKDLTINGVEKKYYYRELKREKWLSQVKTNAKVLRLLDFTANK